MTASTTIRTATLYRLVDLVRADPRLGSAKVIDSHPGPDLPDEAICFGGLEGADAMVSQRAGRKDSDDMWTISVFTMSLGKGQDSRVARARAEQLWNIVRDAVVESGGRLGGTVPGLQSVQLGKLNGPDAEPEGDGEGFTAWVEADLKCTARIN